MIEPSVEKHVEALKVELQARAWSPARVDAAWRKFALRRDAERPHRRRPVKIVAGTLALAALLALSMLGIRRLGSGLAPTATRAATDESGLERIELGDGTEVRLEQGARLDLRERNETRVVVVVRAGTARFQVRHNPQRLFRVEVGEVAVEDLGTTFVVQNTGDFARVAVSEGSVAVTSPEGGQRRKVALAAGEHGVFPLRGAGPRPADVPPPLASSPAAPAAREQPVAGADAQPATNWRELARAGKHQQAYGLLAPTGFRDVRDDAGDLLLASDVARLSRHPAESVVLLRKLLTRHGRDPRAPSAAFTLGWLLMNELGRPREAALAFGQAEALAPRGNLAEDAVARSVEAWYRAGEEMRAKAEVERYRSAYPQGRHLAMLKRLVAMP
jgi:transmembrane sensor